MSTSFPIANGCIYCGKVAAYTNKARRSLSSALVNYRVQCSVCGAIGAMSGTEEGAIRLWNDPPFKHILNEVKTPPNKDMLFPLRYACGNQAIREVMLSEANQAKASEEIKEFFLPEHGK